MKWFLNWLGPLSLRIDHYTKAKKSSLVSRNRPGEIFFISHPDEDFSGYPHFRKQYFFWPKNSQIGCRHELLAFAVQISQNQLHSVVSSDPSFKNSKILKFQQNGAPRRRRSKGWKCRIKCVHVLNVLKMYISVSLPMEAFPIRYAPP